MKKLQQYRQYWKTQSLIIKSCVFSLFYYFFQLLFLITLLSLAIGVISGLFSGFFLIDKSYQKFESESNPASVYFKMNTTTYNKLNSKTLIFDGVKGFEDYTNSEPQKTPGPTSSGIDSGIYLIDKYFNDHLNQEFNHGQTPKDPYFSLMFRDTRVLEDQSGGNVFKVVNFDPDHNQTDKVIIEKGRAPEDNYEIMLSSVFASRNNIHVGNYYFLFGQYYKVVGIANSWDFLYPLINNLNAVSDNSSNGIVYCYKTAYYQFNSSKFNTPQFSIISNVDRDIYLIGGLNEWTKKLPIYSKLQSKVNDLLKDLDLNKIIPYNKYPQLISKFSSASGYLTSNHNTGYYYYRTHLASKTIHYLIVFIWLFSIFIFFITFFIFYNIFRKRFLLEKVNIKVFSFLGYLNSEIRNSYLSWSIIIFILSFFIMFFIAVFSQWMLMKIFNNFFIIPIALNILPLIIIFLTLIIFSFIVISLFNYSFTLVEIAKVLDPPE